MGERWKVYDVVVEGISIVNNYRSQFDRVMARSSFDELLERVKHVPSSMRPAAAENKNRENVWAYFV